MVDYETIRYEVKDSVATIYLNRPEAFNSFTPQMNKEVAIAFKSAERDTEVRAIVLTGEGKAFCAGQDIKTIPEDLDYGKLLEESYHPMMKALRGVTKPVIAAVNGVAAGAGMSLALACDFRLVTSKTNFVSSFLSIGLVPDSGMMYTLPRFVGYAKALEITTLDQPIKGEEAKELGLATEFIEIDEWESRVEAFSAQLAALPMKAFSLMKRYMIEGMNTPFEEGLDQEADAQQIAGLTADHQEGMLAFKEKRKPVYGSK